MTLILLYVLAALLVAVAAEALRPAAPILGLAVCPACRGRGWRMAT